MLLKNVVSIISGGSSGLGAAAAKCLLRNGAKGVVVADLPHQRDTFQKVFLEQEGNTGGGGGGGINDKDNYQKIIFAEVDVTQSEQISHALDLAESTFGEPINAAISCAGIGTARKTISMKGNDDISTLRVHPLEEFTRTLTVNTIGTFNLARLAAERMMKRDDASDDSNLRGCIINTASIAAYEGQIGQVAYSASKGAIVGMTLPMARDLASHKIRVMTIAPGLFRTPLLEGLPEKVQNELGASVPCPSRLGHPDEFGQLCVSILTNPMLNGEVIRLDGAVRMPP